MPAPSPPITLLSSTTETQPINFQRPSRHRVHHPCQHPKLARIPGRRTKRRKSRTKRRWRCCARGCRLAPQQHSAPVKPRRPAKLKQRHERETCLPDRASTTACKNVCSTSHVQLTLDGKIQQPIAQISTCSGISCRRGHPEGCRNFRGAPRQAVQRVQHDTNRCLERHWGSAWEPRAFVVLPSLEPTAHHQIKAAALGCRRQLLPMTVLQTKEARELCNPKAAEWQTETFCQQLLPETSASH